MKSVYYMPATADTGGWKARHADAIRAATGYGVSHTQGSCVFRAIADWCGYAAAHAERFDSPIGDDYVLGPAWAQWGASLRTLLNGETGELDCGTLDSILVDNLTEQGFDGDGERTK